jgi:hypothetical protein
MCDAGEPSQPPNRFLVFDAETLRILWRTNLPGRSHYIPPTIADGQVFVPVGGRFLVLELNR